MALNSICSYCAINSKRTVLVPENHQMKEKQNKRKKLPVKLCGKRETNNVYAKPHNRLKKLSL